MELYTYKSCGDRTSAVRILLCFFIAMAITFRIKLVYIIITCWFTLLVF
jgi:hypothetical protein